MQVPFHPASRRTRGDGDSQIRSQRSVEPLEHAREGARPGQAPGHEPALFGLELAFVERQTRQAAKVSKRAERAATLARPDARRPLVQTEVEPEPRPYLAPSEVVSFFSFDNYAVKVENYCLNAQFYEPTRSASAPNSTGLYLSW